MSEIGTLAASEAETRLVQGYRAPADAYDELLGPDGQPRAHWRSFLEALERLSEGELARRWAKAERLIRENGLTYAVAGEPAAEVRPWSLDPMPLIIAADEWRTIEAAAIQRAELLNAVLADLYGPQRLLAEGYVPAALIFSNPTFLRPCHGAPVRDGVYLHHYAVDIGRAPNGDWWVLRDRTGTPAGLGTTLENRIVLAQSFPDLLRETGAHRLAGFFQAMHDGLMERTSRDEPRIAFLSPGTRHRDSFAHAYLARYLGYTLVEGADLDIRDDRVFVKTLDGLKPIDVILRQVSSALCDPLELDFESTAGAAGLVRAMRAGNVTIANALGSGVVETKALMGFMPAICRMLRGEHLRMPSVATWWCGEGASAEIVRGRAEDLVFEPAFRGPGSGKAILASPGRTDAAARAALLDDIRRRPHEFVARESVRLSTAPVWVDGRLEPRALLLRIHVVATPAGYVVLPGGVARIGAGAEVGIDDPHSGSKDAWVLSDAPVAPTAPGARSTNVHLRRTGADLPSRAADNLFWLGRYAERAEGVSRMLRSVFARLAEGGGPTSGADALRHALVALVPRAAPGSGTLSIEAAVHALMFDAKVPHNLRDTLAHLERTSSIARDRLSIDAWRALNRLHSDPRWRSAEGRIDTSDTLDALDDAIRILAAFSGMEMENMTRNLGWRFLDMGRRLERARYTVALFGQLVVGHGVEGLLALVLELADSSMTYRSRYLTTPQLAPVLDLLVMDEANPRSVAFQFAAIDAHAERLPRADELPGRSPEQRIILGALTELRLADVAALAANDAEGQRSALAALLAHVGDALPRFSDQLTRSYFSHADEKRAPQMTRPGPTP